MKSKVLSDIKRDYGENMMHFVREKFATALDKGSLVYDTISRLFSPNKSLYNDLYNNLKENDFISYIYLNMKDKEKKEEKVVTGENPYELMSDAGYKLYKCETEDEIQSFKKYYEKGESLCTFNGGRLDTCYVYFAVKKNVDDIKREDFKSPIREDKYGTSVISIQFDRDTHMLSIKNRYNHKVSNPDATFGNNLENIIPGLTTAFESELGFEINKSNQTDDFEMGNYVRASDGKFYRYTYEIDGNYYCPNYYIIHNGKPEKINKAKYLMIECLYLDKDKKEIYSKYNIDESILRDIKIENLNITKSENGNTIVCINNGIIIELDSLNRIIKYSDNITENVKDNFLKYNEVIDEISMPNLRKVGDNFLLNNNSLKVLNMNSVERVGNDFLPVNRTVRKIDMKNLNKVGDSFFKDNMYLTSLNMPNLEIVGDNFLEANMGLKHIELRKLISTGSNFLENCFNLEDIKLDSLEEYEDGFLRNAISLKNIYMPSVKKENKTYKK